MSFSYAKYNLPNTSGGSLTVRGALWVSQLSKFVAVGGRTGGTAVDCVVTSPDGITWTNHNGSEGNNWSGLAYSPTLGSGSGRLVAVSPNGTHRVMYSDNGGTSWTNATAAAANAWGSVAWSSTLNLFVAVGGSSSSIMTSSDGITWSSQTAASVDSWAYVVWADSRFIAGAMNNTAETHGYQTSTNGTAWSSLTTPSCKPGLNTNLYSSFLGNITLCFSSDLNMWVALALTALNATEELYSTDHGANWTAITPFSASVHDVCWAHELSTFIATSGFPGIHTSTDGLSWTFEDLSAFDPNDFWVKVCYASDLECFVAFNQGNTETVLFGAGATPLAPTSGPANGQTTLTIHGDGATNGGFTKAGADVQISIGVDLANNAFSPFLNAGDPYNSIIPHQATTPYGRCTNISISDSANLTCVNTNGAAAANDVLVWDNNNVLGGHNVLLWLPAAFTYTNPTITSGAPSHGFAGTAVTLTGHDLFKHDYELNPILPDNPGTVTFDGVSATDVTYVNSTTVTCVAPAHIDGHAPTVDVVYTSRQLLVVFAGTSTFFSYAPSTVPFTYDETSININNSTYVDGTTSDGALLSGDADMGGTGLIVLTADGGIKFGGLTEMDILVASVPVAQLGGQWSLDAFNFKGRSEDSA